MQTQIYLIDPHPTGRLMKQHGLLMWTSPPIVLSWNSWNWPLTKRSTKLDFPTADSPSSTSLNWQILFPALGPLGLVAPPRLAMTVTDPWRPVCQTSLSGLLLQEARKKIGLLRISNAQVWNSTRINKANYLRVKYVTYFMETNISNKPLPSADFSF